MKKLVTVFLLVLFASPSFAQGAGDVKTKFYDFDDLLIDGEYKKPQIMYTDTDKKVRFERLLKLKKEFLPRLRATSRDSSLR